MSDPGPASLSGLIQAAADLHVASKQLDVAVVTARLAGVSWTVIGETLDMTRQSAHERWRGIVDRAELAHINRPLAQNEEVDLARAILAALHAINDPSDEQVTAAADQVQCDPAGARILAEGLLIPRDRPDLRTARSEGRYLQRSKFASLE